MIIEDKCLGKYRVVAETKQFTVQKKYKNKKDEIEWDNISYYTNLSNALLEVCKLRTSEKDKGTIKDYIDFYKSVLNEVFREISPTRTLL